jgi:hypothetical protein
MRVLLRAAVLAVLAVSLAIPAQADHGGIHPTLRTEKTYFHCAGPVKVQNVYVAQGTIPSWNATAPTQSVQQGAGCGYYENLAAGGTGAFTAVWEGTFTGNLDTLTVELHRLGTTHGATLPNRLATVVTIDGVSVFTGDANITPTESASGASSMAKFSLRRLNLKTEDGDGTQERTIRVSLDSYNETQSAWVWDTTDVPAGITFNPASLAGSTIVN